MWILGVHSYRTLLFIWHSHHCFSTLPALARLFLLCPKLPPPPPPTLPLPFAALPPAAARLLVDGVVGHLCAPLLLHLGAAADYAPPPADTLAVDTADADALLPPGTPAAAAADTERHVDVAQAVWSSEPAPLGQRQLPDRLARTEAARSARTRVEWLCGCARAGKAGMGAFRFSIRCCVRACIAPGTSLAPSRAPLAPDQVVPRGRPVASFPRRGRAHAARHLRLSAVRFHGQVSCRHAG